MSAETIQRPARHTDFRSIRAGQRAIIAGRTGTGKSEFARRLAGRTGQIVIVSDAKGDVGYPDSVIIDDPEDLTDFRRSAGRNLIYRPAPAFWTREHWDGFYRWVYEFRDCVIYTDEMFGIMPDGRSPVWFKAVQTRGRSLNITSIACTQRPFSIPLAVLSESEHRVMFDLSLLDDRKRMAELMPGTSELDGREVPIVLQKLRGPHNFFYYNIVADLPTKEYCLVL